MKTFALAFAVLLLSNIQVNAQDDSPVAYMGKISKQLDDINVKYIAYLSASSHGSIRKAEKKRQAMMDQIEKSKANVNALPYYKGDKDLQKAAMDYMRLLTDVQNENYAKVVNLEDIAEQSYDNMEAYLLLKKKVNEKMHDAGEAQSKAQQAFCAKNNITLRSVEDEMSLKMKKANQVMDYQDVLYLIFFKCSAQENSLMQAIEKHDITAIEQSKNSMVKYADEGLSRLDTIKSFEGDATLKTACKRSLEFFKKEADKTSVTTDFFMKSEAFEQVKKSFENNPNAKKDKNEIDKFNKAVNDINAASNNYNNNGQKLNSDRKAAYEDWNNTQKAFLDTHVPYS